MAIPNLALIPTGYKAGKVYSVLPESGVGDFAFTRASEATRINSAGLLEVEATGVPRLEYPLIDGVVNGCPSLLLENQATNLITYPISFGNPYWTKSGATIEGDPSTAGSELLTGLNWVNSGSFGYETLTNNGDGKVVFSNTSGFGTATLSAGMVLGKTYLIEFTTGTGTYTQTRFQITSNVLEGASGQKFIILSPSTSYSFYITISTTNGATPSDLGLWTNNGANDNGSIDAISIKEVQGYSSPSVDFPTSAFKLVEDTSTGSHRTTSVDWIFITGGTTATQSAYVKANGRTIVGLQDLALGAGHAVFNLSTVTVLAVNGVSAKIETLVDGWFRISYTFVTGGVGSQPYKTGIFALDTYTTGAPLSYSYTGDGTSGIYLFMAQFEAGSYATSPTLTSLTAEGTTTTRVAEVCNGAGDASTFNDSEGVLMAEISALANDGTYRLIQINDGTVNNMIAIGYTTISNQLLVEVRSAGGAIDNFTYTISDVLVNNKLSLKYKVNDVSLWVNGFEVQTITTATMPIGLSTLNFDYNNSTLPFYGKTKQIQYFNTVLTDAELETLTSWTSFISMANSQNYNII